MTSEFATVGGGPGRGRWTAAFVMTVMLPLKKAVPVELRAVSHVVACTMAMLVAVGSGARRRCVDEEKSGTVWAIALRPLF